MLRLLAFIVLLIVAPAAYAQDFPKLTGRVVDQAKLLSSEQAQAIAAKSEALQQSGGPQLVVVTLASLDGRDIESYANDLFRKWTLGDKTRDDGILLLIAPAERRVRIEVGYGLEPILTDALSSIIIRREILSRFKEGDIPGGISAGADAIIAQVSLPPDQAAARQQQLVAAEKRKEGGGVPITLIFWLVVVVLVILPMLTGGVRGRRYRGGRGPVVIWGCKQTAYLVYPS